MCISPALFRLLVKSAMPKPCAYIATAIPSHPYAPVYASIPAKTNAGRASLDEAVSIRGIKRFMVEQEVTIQLPEMRENEANAKRKVAIIGAGPSGLTCAYFLARLGYQPKVFESTERPGGMLVQAIPAYRMPREELAREIRMIERMGVEIETNKALGKDFTLQQLRDEGYEAVFVGVGAPSGAKLRIANEDADGVYDSMAFLREYNLRGNVPVGKKVVVIGGGNAAIDAARTAMRPWCGIRYGAVPSYPVMKCLHTKKKLKKPKMKASF